MYEYMGLAENVNPTPGGGGGGGGRRSKHPVQLGSSVDTMNGLCRKKHFVIF